MATINIIRSHQLGYEQARNMAERVAQQLQQDLDIAYHWEDSRLKFKRPGANGHIQVAADTVQVAVDLAMMLRPLRGKIEAEIHRYLDSAFA